MPEDSAVNTWAFATGTPDLADAVLVSDAVQDFYTNVPVGGTLAPGAYLSNQLDRGALASRMQVYDITGFLDGSPHGSPMLDVNWTLSPAASAGSDLPEEVALRITIEATGRSAALVETADGIDPGTEVDRPRARRTGGIYFGPLNHAASNLSGGVNGHRPLALFLTDLRLAVQDLHDDTALNAAGLSVAVWSRQDAAVRSLEAVSTDNAFDSQRRRGPDATSRVRLPL